MPTYTYECRACGYRADEVHTHTIQLSQCPHCKAEAYKKDFGFFPGAKMSTIRQLSERDPRYWAWLNSDEVKADVAAGKLRPIGKHEDQAHGDGGPISSGYETPRDKEKRLEGYEREFVALGCPTIKEQEKLMAEGKL